MRYIPLWCKSNYSFLEGASHPEELVDRAADLGLTRLAVTDRNGVYGIVRAFDRARNRGVNLIVGTQVSVGVGTNLVLLAQSREGYANLCALLSLGHRGQEKQVFNLTWPQVASHSAHLVALWGPSVLGISRELELDTLSGAFSGRLYVLVCRHRWFDDVLLESETLQWAARYRLPVVAAQEVLYHDPGRQELQDLVTCIRSGVRLADAGRLLRPNSNHGLITESEFEVLFSDHPDWVSRTVEVAELCTFSLDELEYRYPEEGVPEGFTTASWVRKLTFNGAKKRYGCSIPDEVQVQLGKELELIEELRYAGYFLTMWEIVEFCKAQGILCQGRGSAANSAVCFCLGITAVDPVRMSLLFERFLSKERSEPPDIDLDIEHHRREEVIQWMYRRYGRSRAAMVANVVRYRSRSSLREVGKVLGIPEVDLDRSSRLLAHHDEGVEGAIRDAGLDSDSLAVQRLNRLASQLRGFPRHLSIHPGGFLLGSEELSRIVPVEPATMEGRTVIQWDKTDVETMNLFKVDLLGLGALSHLDYAFRLLKTHYRQDLSMTAIPSKDKEVFDMLCRADTVGVFQIESRAQMAMLPRLKPRTYYDLVIEVSLVRPGPITGGMVHPYLKRRAGLEEITFPHESLKPVLAKTLGIPLFQEQVMKLAMVAADYSPGEADQLRRDMAAWKSSGRIEAHHEKLVGRMTAKGIDREFAERVFDQIRGFGEYGFPESHAASFALIAYATAWVKCHYADVFACALLNAWPMGFYSPATIIGDAKRHQVTVLPIDIQHSSWDCTLEPDRPGWPRFAVRMGLRYIKGLRKSDADRILTHRTENPPVSLTVWKAQAGVGIDAWEKLALGGALRGFGIHRRDALWDILDPGTSVPLDLETSTDPHLDEPDSTQGILWDYATAGLSTQAHILEQWRPRLRADRFDQAVVLNAAGQPRRARFVGLVICRQMPGNAKGILFLTLEDETGLVNVVVWKAVWDRFRKVILTSPLLAVEGKLQVEDGVTHLISDRFWVPELPGDSQTVPSPSHDFR